MKKAFVVCGRFDEEGGGSSRLAIHMMEGLHSAGWSPDCVNGGHVEALGTLLPYDAASKYELVLWIPDVPNRFGKHVGNVKRFAPYSTLVESKRNSGQYSHAQLVDRMLAHRANFMLEIRHDEQFDLYECRILDPLGNIHADWMDDFCEAGEKLGRAVSKVRGATRIRSRCADANREPVPDESLFFDLIRRSAARFRELVPSVENPSRFVGNASFRCTKGGFPSFRSGDKIFVSRRNIDKQEIGRDGFVGVKASVLPVEYFGDHKPSVDTPPQLALYDAFPKINYIMHGHVYVEGAPSTGEHFVCGSMEEADAVKRMFGPEVPSFVVNLKGHGFLAAACCVSELEPLLDRLVARPVPETLE